MMNTNRFAFLLLPLVALGLLLPPAPVQADAPLAIPVANSPYAVQSFVFATTGGTVQLQMTATPGITGSIVMIGSTNMAEGPLWSNLTDESKSVELQAGSYVLMLLPSAWSSFSLTGPGLQLEGATPTVTLANKLYTVVNQSITLQPTVTGLPADKPLFFISPAGDQPQEVLAKPDGSFDPVTFSTTGLEDGIYHAVVTASSDDTHGSMLTLPILVDRKSAFPDVPADHWARRHVEVGHHLGVINGRTDGSFGPTASVTRAEFAKMLAAAIPLETEEGAPAFTDVSGHWAAPWINALAKKGIVKGKSVNGKLLFEPNSTISRQEAATLIARAYELQSSAKPLTFADTAQIDTWAAGSIGALVELKWMTGYAGGTVKPKGLLQRAEAAKLLTAPLGL